MWLASGNITGAFQFEKCRDVFYRPISRLQDIKGFCDQIPNFEKHTESNK